MGEKDIRYELYFAYYIVDDFFPQYPPNKGYSTIEKARERALAEPDMKAYRIVECDRKIVEEKKVK